MNTALHSLYLAIAIPGTSYDVTTKTALGWVMGVTLLYLGYRAMSAAMSAHDERDKEARKEKITMAVVIFAVGLAIFGVLYAMGIISLTDIQSAMNQV